MSDGAAWFATATEYFGMLHVRCLKHLQEQQLKARADLTDRGTEFMRATSEQLTRF